MYDGTGLYGLRPEFDKRNCRIIGLSVDSVSDHSRWAKDIEETQSHTVTYPMIGDPQPKVAKLYDMLPAKGLLSADRQTSGGDPSQLEARRGRDYRPVSFRRAGQSKVPRWLESAQTIPADRPTAAPETAAVNRAIIASGRGGSGHFEHDRSARPGEMTAMGHEDAFLAVRLNGRCRIRNRSVAGDD
jgi:hypothetical protein